MVHNLARDLIELSGLRPGQDIAIKFTRLGQGEKLSEELLDRDREQLLPSGLERISVVRQAERFNVPAFARRLEAVEAAACRFSADDVVEALERMEIGFRRAGMPGSQTVRAEAASLGKQASRAVTSKTALPGAVIVQS